MHETAHARARRRLSLHRTSHSRSPRASSFDPEENGVVGEFTLAPGESESFVLETVARRYALPRLLPTTCGGEFEDTVEFWRRWLGTVALSRALAGDGAPLGAGSQAAHLPAVWRDGRRADDEPAGTDRRRPELGLPLHVDSGHSLLPLCAAPARLHGRGRRLHGLADGSFARARRSRVRPAPDHVRRRRQLRAPGGGSRPLRGLSGVGARADRERRRQPAPARHLRRADRFGLPLQQVRHADLPWRLERSGADRGVGLRELGPGRRGDLGDARRAASTSRSRG